MRNAFVIFKKGRWWQDYRWRGLGSRLAKDIKNDFAGRSLFKRMFT